MYIYFEGRKEINPQLESVVATLSTGPVGPSDMLNHTNATLIMRFVDSLFCEALFFLAFTNILLRLKYT